jgi:hypothetical protein
MQSPQSNNDAPSSLTVITADEIRNMATACWQAVIVTYDGWYSPIYFMEENWDPAKNLPRSSIGGAPFAFHLESQDCGENDYDFSRDLSTIYRSEDCVSSR